ncbi:MAG: glycosyltransferase family 39 protein [Heliobacteriaceae bacterium]|nr:glycosyltransferase family 39 protein [Heliobacteriaceae bacterium]
MCKRLGVCLIVLSGLMLRLLFVDKPDGLWNDEYVSWMIAAVPFGKGFIAAVKTQCHMPFYYLYLKFFMALFGQSDLLLRLTSVLAGVGGIIGMYFAGSEKDRQTGLFCAGFAAISSFLIYYSQEVRFYSLLFLLSSLSLLYTMRTIKTPSKKNLALCIGANFMIMFTHTIGFVFVFFNLLALSVMLFKQSRKYILCAWAVTAAGALSLLPLTAKILTAQSFSQWWNNFSPAKIGFLVTDYFSPALTNLVSSPSKFFYNPSLGFIMFAVIPSVIALIFLFRSLQNRDLRWLFGVTAAVLSVLTAAAMAGKLVFLTKYSIEIYPVLIFLTCSGITSFNNKTLRNALVGIYCALCIIYMVKSPVAAFKIRRAEGHKIAAELIKNAGLNKGDIILLEYYPKERFEKYFDFSNYNVVSVNKNNFADYLAPSTEGIYKNGKDIYKPIFLANENEFFAEKINKNITENLKEGRNVAVLTLNSVSFCPVNIAENEAVYKKTPFLYLVFSYIKNQSVYELSKSLSLTRFESKGEWSLIRFTKLHKTPKTSNIFHVHDSLYIEVFGR